MISLSFRWAAFNPTVRRKLKQQGTLLQNRYWEHQIRDERDFERHLDYLHWNPVKYGYAKSVADWRYVKQGIYPLDWATCGAEIAAQFGE